ncbi:MAG: hypothetical protein HJJLKODD_00968 [Phycisphaerae bacterium]|nr:hypothetical protein [Phycisphaerae bacterium]
MTMTQRKRNLIVLLIIAVLVPSIFVVIHFSDTMQIPKFPRGELTTIENFMELRLPNTVSDFQLRYQPYTHEASLHIICDFSIKDLAELKASLAWNESIGQDTRIVGPLEGRMQDWIDIIRDSDDVFYQQLDNGGYRTVVIRTMTQDRCRLFYLCLADKELFSTALTNCLYKGAIRLRGFEFRGLE